MKGKDIILDYCKTVKTHDMEHLQNSLDNEHTILFGKIEDMVGCPSTYGLDDFHGLCFFEQVEGLKAQEKQCNLCWKLAFEMEVDVDGKST